MKILIIPDIHGRNFWKEPCEHIDEFDKVVCLGDYHDPYPSQVSRDTSRHLLRDDFVPLVENHRDKFICLFGNHDGNYLSNTMADRVDFYHKKEITELLKKLNLQLTYEVDEYLFSHSGVLPRWIEMSVNLSGNSIEKVRNLNTLPFNDFSLMSTSSYRGGLDPVGSCVWGDVREYDASYHYSEWYQIFGHTHLKKEIIEKDYACLDCEKTFVLDTKTKELKNYSI